MGTGHILLLCLLGAVLFSSVICNNANGPDKCCFKYYPRRLNKNLVSSYVVTDERCQKPAVILITKKGRDICADPNLSWVEGIMKSVDENTL